MTTRRLNYTGRRRVRRSDVRVQVDHDAVPAFFFTCRLDDYGFPRHLPIVIEAQAHWTLMRFECGTVGSPLVHERFTLSDFSTTDGLLFRLKVLGADTQAGLILGEADGIRPALADDPGGGRSLLAVQSADLGDVVWRLSFAGPEPLLQVNDRLGDWRSFVRRPEVRSILLPEVYRQLLRRAVEVPADADANDAWQTVLLQGVPPASGRQPRSDDEDALDQWVDEAVRLFASKHRMFRGIADWGGDT